MTDPYLPDEPGGVEFAGPLDTDDRTAPPSVPVRNADPDWDAWPVEQYLTENYRTLHPCDAAVIEHHSRYYRRFAPGALARTVEIGAGPNLYPLMLPAAASRAVDAVEVSAAGLGYLRRQLADGPDPSWQPFYDRCRALNPDLPEALTTALSQVRPVLGDLHTVPVESYDLASMHFVAESITADEDEFRRFCRAFTLAVPIGGHLVAAFMRDMPTYRLGDGSTWPGYPVDDTVLREVMGPYTVELRLTDIEQDPTLPAYGDAGMIALTARRAR